MIAANVPIYVALDSIDMRKSFDSLRWRFASAWALTHKAGRCLFSRGKMACG